jgi:uncharacterized protein YbaR (Trm112 family)
MFGFSSENADVVCPDCRRPLVPVRSFAQALGLDTTVLADDFASPMDHSGELDGPGATLFAFQVLNAMVDGVLGWFHKLKAKRLCRRLLEENPRTKTLICASCLFVYRRK